MLHEAAPIPDTVNQRLLSEIPETFSYRYWQSHKVSHNRPDRVSFRPGWHVGCLDDRSSSNFQYFALRVQPCHRHADSWTGACLMSFWNSHPMVATRYRKHLRIGMYEISVNHIWFTLSFSRSRSKYGWVLCCAPG